MILSTPDDFELLGTTVLTERKQLSARPTFTTLESINKIVKQWGSSPRVRELGERLTAWTEQHNTQQQAEAVFNWVQSHTRYMKDPVGTELLRTPEVMLDGINRDGFAALDCDDYVVLLGSLLASVGIPVRAHKVGFTREPEEFSHIYLEAKVAPGFCQEEKWMPLDPTFPGSVAGKTWRAGRQNYIENLGQAEPLGHVPAGSPPYYLYILALLGLLWLVRGARRNS